MDLHLDVRVIERAQGPWASVGYLLGLALGAVIALVAIAVLFGFSPIT